VVSVDVVLDYNPAVGLWVGKAYDASHHGGRSAVEPRKRTTAEELKRVMSLLPLCSIAFVSVFILLAFLAVAMYLITVIFPERREAVDVVLAAAISSTVASVYPGARVTRIEEER
jgi:hypothetical protein